MYSDALINGESLPSNKSQRGTERVEHSRSACSRGPNVISTPLRALNWKRPKGHHAPVPFELALSRITKAIQTRSGAFYDALAHAPILGAGDERYERSRRRRSDGMQNIVALLSAAIMVSDPRGFLGRPRHDGAGWERLSWSLLDHYAFGARVRCERSFRRTQRIIRELAALGFVRVREIRVKRNGGFESLVAVKHLTEKFWRMIGVWQNLTALRRQRDRDKSAARVRELGVDAKAASALTVHDNGKGKGGATAPPPSPHPTPPPQRPRTDPAVAAAHFEEIQKMLRGK